MGGMCYAWGNHYHLTKLWLCKYEEQESFNSESGKTSWSYLMMETLKTRRISTVKVGEIIPDFSSAETKH